MLKFYYLSSKKTKYLFLLIMFFTLLIIWVATKSETKNLNQLITEKMTECGKQNNDSCYKDIAESSVQKYKIKDVLQVFAQNEKQPIFFQKCHTTLHFLGQETYKNTKNTTKALNQGLPICFSGFYHGVLEAYLNESNLINNNEKLTEEIPKLCGGENNFPLKKINECLHGLGHALMFATNNDLLESLKLCDSLETEIDRGWCYSGSFMENSTSSTNKDHPSKYLKSEDIMYPCNILAEKYLDMCYTLQGFYFAELSTYNWQKTSLLCLQVPKPYDKGCFNSIGQSLVGFTQDPEIMKQNCLLLPKEFQADCVSGVVGAMHQRYDNGPEKIEPFCNALPNNLKIICEQRNQYDQ